MTTAEVLRLLRAAVFLAAAVAGVAAVAAMAVQQGLFDRFGRTARTIHRLTDPLLAPIARRLMRTRMDPRHAPWWLIGITIFAGILTLSLAEWVAIQAMVVRAAAAHGGSSVAYLLVDWGLGLLGIALIVRVVGSWVGATAYTPWMRPFVIATEWLLAPLRRVIPSFAMMDLSPLVAWFLIQVVRSLLLSAL